MSILAGGIGSRFWPASTPARPKPLLALASERPLVRDALDRAIALAPRERISILANADLSARIAGMLPDLPPESYWREPRAKGTGPVLAWAAHRIHTADPDAVLVSLHSDHLIAPESAFATLVSSAARLAVEERLLLTVAARPDRAEIGYGYIEPGRSIPASGGLDAFRIGRFVEKPDRTTAEEYVRRGYLWNTGIFILPVATFLEEVERHAPEIAPHMNLIDDGGTEAYFEAVTAVSIDHAVFERSSRTGAAVATFAWDDVGTWEAVARAGRGDAHGNHMMGEVHAVDANRNVVWTEDGAVALFGVDDLVVVRSHGVTLVTSRERSSQLKELLAELPERLQRLDPWGEPDPSGRAGPYGKPDPE